MTEEPTTEDIQQVEDLAAKLFTHAQIGDYFGWTGSTLRNRLKEHEKFRCAYKKGRAKALETVTTALWDLVKEKNPAAVFFILKTKFGYRETDPGPVDDPDTVAARLKVALQQIMEDDG